MMLTWQSPTSSPSVQCTTIDVTPTALASMTSSPWLKLENGSVGSTVATPGSGAVATL
jgi:hypothetical protein